MYYFLNCVPFYIIATLFYLYLESHCLDIYICKFANMKTFFLNDKHGNQMNVYEYCNSLFYVKTFDTEIGKLMHQKI